MIRFNIEIAITSRSVQDCFCEIGTLVPERSEFYVTIIPSYICWIATVYHCPFGVRTRRWDPRKVVRVPLDKGPPDQFHPDTFGCSPFIYFFVLDLYRIFFWKKFYFFPGKKMLASAQTNKNWGTRWPKDVKVRGHKLG